MNCPECGSTDIDRNHEHADTLGVVCVCVPCESTWIADRAGNIELNTVSPGANRRALQAQIDRDDFTRQFNDPDGFGL